MTDIAAPVAGDDDDSYLAMIRDYECPDGCEFAYLLSEAEAADIIGGDEHGFLRCPWCGEELELTLEAAIANHEWLMERLAATKGQADL